MKFGITDHKIFCDLETGKMVLFIVINNNHASEAAYNNYLLDINTYLPTYLDSFVIFIITGYVPVLHP